MRRNPTELERAEAASMQEQIERLFEVGRQIRNELDGAATAEILEVVDLLLKKRAKQPAAYALLSLTVNEAFTAPWSCGHAATTSHGHARPRSCRQGGIWPSPTVECGHARLGHVVMR